jgi:hypothetical protein
MKGEAKSAIEAVAAPRNCHRLFVEPGGDLQIWTLAPFDGNGTARHAVSRPRQQPYLVA